MGTRTIAIDAATVMAGGMAGTLLREAVVLGLPRWEGIGLPLLVVNVLGSACLGLVVSALPAAWRRTRLLLGTGLIGGFTSYSAFALDLGHLLAEGRWPAMIGYAAVSVLGGLAAAAAGIALGARPSRGDGGAGDGRPAAGSDGDRS
ncbi:fluoride efflux transporter FluC [Mycetocola reblochoni]|uniref:Fluoride-specific ion channel FluC n=2 Tax=Mycetocola reblochoni TaxID=331618 RepID=A0A1R4IFG7_9MICO|nr:CrcB family protein [Mycetocola reblochoni]RLP68986.1 CrcB family protein [Mycetocola reblochoni]SJN18582.1 CrcB protein [Mycetocola reblochoni REB411]